METLISIHDVMPETLDRVRALVDQCRTRGLHALTLLVVPGRPWSPDQLAELAAWQGEGVELAAHGWSHRVERFGGLYHRLHGALLSRRAAENLALSPAAVAERMHAAARWFPDNGLAAPTTYVPPAWALGRVDRHALANLPYRRVEVTRGLLDLRTRRLQPLPLVGFEADTALRAAFLRGWNRYQRNRATGQRLPLRVAIHPYDPELRLGGDLRALLDRKIVTLRYDALPETG